MAPKKWSRSAIAPEAAATGSDKPNMAKRFGFKESREERESREAQEKQNKWEERLQKEDLSKLEAEFESLSRARFLAPQQKIRKNLVDKMVRDLKKRQAVDAKNEASECGSAAGGVHAEASRLTHHDNENDDDDGDILRDIVEAETLNTSQMQFVPRKVARRHGTSAANTVATPADEAAIEEQKLLAAMAEDPDDFEDILDSI